MVNFSRIGDSCSIFSAPSEVPLEVKKYRRERAIYSTRAIYWTVGCYFITNEGNTPCV